jgi:hypothetical protein
MIYLIITTSINNKNGLINDEHRKNRYLESISSTLQLIENNKNIKPIIVENNGNSDTYLNNLNCDVVYTNNNKLELYHKGVNELLDIKYVINHYNINDNDIIIKLTGRYKILNNDFFNLIIDNENNDDKIDAFVKFYNVCVYRYIYDDCVLGLIAIRCKYLRNFEYNCEKCPEYEFATFVRNNVEKYTEVTDLGLECCFADDFRIINV